MDRRIGEIRESSEFASTSGDDEPFTIKENRRRNKRKRIEPPQKFMPADGKNKKTSKPLLVGKAKNSSSVANMKAADRVPEAPRSFYYVGNLHTRCSTDNVAQYLKNAKIPVITVFPVGKNEIQGRDRKFNAFRVCIESKYDAVFLNENIWPDRVFIRNWIFNDDQNKDAASEEDKRSKMAMELRVTEILFVMMN